MIFEPQEMTVWVVATHKVGEPIEAEMYVTKDEAIAAYEEIDFANEPLMDCKRMFAFDLVGSLEWGGREKIGTNACPEPLVDATRGIL